MNQALQFHEHPDRLAACQRKTKHTIELLRATAKKHNCEIIWVLIPPFDLVFPDKVANASPLAAATVKSGVQAKLHNWFRSLLEEGQNPVIDLLDDFKANATLGIYAYDFHIWTTGHKMLADALEPQLRTILKK